MKKIFIILLILFSISAFANTITDKDKQMQFTVTQGFEDAMPVISRINPFAKIALTKDNYKVFITAQDSVLNSKPQEAHKSLLYIFESDGAKIIQDEVITIDGVEGNIVTAVVEYDHVYKYLILDFVKSGKHYLIMGWTYEKSFPEYEKLLYTTLMTFKVLK